MIDTKEAKDFLDEVDVFRIPHEYMRLRDIAAEMNVRIVNLCDHIDAQREKLKEVFAIVDGHDSEWDLVDKMSAWVEKNKALRGDPGAENGTGAQETGAGRKEKG